MLAFWLAVVMVLGVVPVHTLAQNDGASQQSTLVSSRENAVGENPLAAVVAAAVNENAQTTGSPYGIHRIVMNGLKAAVEFTAAPNSTLLVAVFDEQTGEMVTSGKTAVDDVSQQAMVSLAKCALPTYYIVRGFLLNADNAPIAEAFEELRYTKAMQAFYALTPEDFDPDHIVFNVNDRNFAAVSADAIPFKSSDKENKLIEKNAAAGLYTFSAPSAALKALKKGDVFYVDMEDDLVVGTVVSVKINKDGSLTVATDTKQDAIDLFDYIHIDTDALPSSGQSGKKAAPEKESEFDELKRKEFSKSLPVSFTVPANPSEALYPADWKGTTGVNNNSLKTTSKAEKKLSAVFSGTVSVSVSMEYCYHKTLLGKEKHIFSKSTTLKYDTSVSVTGSGTLSFSIDFIKLDIPIAAVPGLFVYTQISLSVSLTAKVTGTGHVILENTTTHNYQAGEKKTTSKKPVLTVSFDAQAQITLSVKLKFAVGVEIAFGVVKAGLYTDLTGTGTLTPFSLKIKNSVDTSGKDAEWDGEISPEYMRAWPIAADGKHKISHDCSLCVTGNVKLEGHFGFELHWGLRDMLDTDDYKYTQLTEILNTDIDLIPPVEFYNRDARLSLINGAWEFSWMEPGELCAHAKILTTVKVVDPSGAPVGELPLTFINRKTYNVKTDQKGTEIFINKTTKTDAAGEAKIYLPASEYSLDVDDDDCKIVSSTPANAWFKMTDQPQEFKLTVKKAQDVVVTLTDKETGEAISGAHITGGLKEQETNAQGKATIKLFPNEACTLTVSADGVTRTYTPTIQKDTKSLALQMDLGFTMTVTVTNKYGEAMAGATVKAANGETGATDATGTAKIKAKAGINTISATLGGKSVSKNLMVEKKETITLQLPLGRAVYCSVVDENNNPLQGIAVDKYGTTDENGKATIYLDTGTYTLTAKNSNGGKASKTVTVDKSGINVEFILKAEPFWWKIEGDTLYIGGNGPMPNYDYNRQKAPWSSSKSSIKSIIIQYGIQTIGERAFSDCVNLTNVTIPGSVTSIGNYAFSDCTSLVSLTIPDSVTSLGNSVLRKCTGITKVIISNGVTNIPNGTFYKCVSLTSITIPDGVKIIGNQAFEGCSGLKSMVLPDTVTTIGLSAFNGCTSMTSVTIPDSVTDI